MWYLMTGIIAFFLGYLWGVWREAGKWGRTIEEFGDDRLD